MTIYGRSPQVTIYGMHSVQCLGAAHLRGLVSHLHNRCPVMGTPQLCRVLVCTRLLAGRKVTVYGKYLR